MTDYIEEYILSANNPSVSLIKAKSVRFNVINSIMHSVIENDLSDMQRKCIVLYINSCTQQEIASKYNISQATVSKHIASAKHKINTQLDYCFLAVEIALKEYIC